MEAVFLHIVNIAITASWLVLVVFLLRLALKKAPKWATCLLWGIVALRLILPFSLESALSLIPNTEPILEQSVVTEAPSVQPIQPDENQSSTPSMNEKPSLSGNQVITPPSSGSLEPAPEASVDPVQIVLFVASIVWLCGVFAMLGYGAYSYWHLKHKLRASIGKEGKVYLCDNIETPFILGVFRPRIYLPSGIGESEIPYVIVATKTDKLNASERKKAVETLVSCPYLAPGTKIYLFSAETKEGRQDVWKAISDAIGEPITGV